MFYQNKTQISLLASAVAAAVLSPAAFSADNATDKNSKLEQVVVVASRIQVPLRQQATAISVINKIAIENRGQSSLMDVLRSQTGINVSNSGGAGKASALRIRGEEGYRTKVFIDGIDISDPTGTQIGPQIQHISSAGIERVEILRGPQGMAYGADAGGVVLITSSTGARELEGSVNAEFGRFNTRNGSANIAAGNDVGDFSLTVSKQKTDGFNARTIDASGEEDGYDNTTGHFNAGLNLGKAWRVDLTLRDVDGSSEYDGFSASSNHDNTANYEQRNQRLAVSYNGESQGHSLAISKSDVKRENISSSSFSAEGEIEQLQYIGFWDVNDTNKLVFGVDRDEQSDTLNHKSRTQDGVHAEWQAQPLQDLFVTVGVRHDENDDFGTHNSYRASAAYFVPVSIGELKLKTSYGTGFRAPSLSELAYNSGSFAFGEAASITLLEENSKGFDIGAQWFISPSAELEVVYFDQTIEDEIYFDLQSYSGYLQALGESRSKVAEVSFEQALSEDWTLRANVTYNDTETTANDQRRRRPRWLANWGMDYEYDNGILLSANWRTANGQTDASNVIADYNVLDVQLRWTINSSLTVFTRVENALDENYQEVPSYNTAGTGAYAGVKLSF